MKRIIILRGTGSMTSMVIGKYALEYANLHVFPIVEIGNFYCFDYYTQNKSSKSGWVNLRIDVISDYEHGIVRAMSYDIPPLLKDSCIVTINTDNLPVSDQKTQRWLGDKLLKIYQQRKFKYVNLNHENDGLSEYIEYGGYLGSINNKDI